MDYAKDNTGSSDIDSKCITLYQKYQLFDKWVRTPLHIEMTTQLSMYVDG